MSSLMRFDRLATPLLVVLWFLPTLGFLASILAGEPEPSWLVALRLWYGTLAFPALVLTMGGIYWYARRIRREEWERAYWSGERLERWRARRSKGVRGHLLSRRTLLVVLGTTCGFIVSMSWLLEWPLFTMHSLTRFAMFAALFTWFQISTWKDMDKRYLAFAEGGSGEAP